MTRQDVQTNLRLPADLKDRLTASADANNRSLSAEVAHRLEQSYTGTSKPDLDLLLAEAQYDLATAHLQMRSAVLEGADLAYTWRAMWEADDRAMQETAATAQIDIWAVLQTCGNLISALRDTENADQLISRIQEGQTALEKARSKFNSARGIEPASRESPYAGGSGLESESADEKVIIRKEPDLAKPKPSRGPTRSPNARKPRL